MHKSAGRYLGQVKQNNLTNILFSHAIVSETNFVLVLLPSLTLTEGPKIYFRCGRVCSCPDQEVTGQGKLVLVLALGVLYPSPGWLLLPRAARKIKRGLDF